MDTTITNHTEFIAQQTERSLRYLLKEIIFFGNRHNSNEITEVLPTLPQDYDIAREELKELVPELNSNYPQTEDLIQRCGLSTHFALTPTRYFRILDGIDWENETEEHQNSFDKLPDELRRHFQEMNDEEEF